MSDVYLPETSHVVRYIKPRFFNDGEISGEAFQLRKNERDGLSVNWLEYFGDIPKDQQLDNVRRSIGIKIKSTGRFAELAVGKTQQFLKDDSDCEARFVHRPLKANGSQKEDPSPAKSNTGSPPAVGDGPRAVPSGGWYDTGAVHFRINLSCRSGPAHQEMKRGACRSGLPFLPFVRGG